MFFLVVLNASKLFYLHGSHTFEWVLGCYAKLMISDWGLWTACPHFNGNSTLLWLKQQFTPKLVYGVEALLQAKRRFQCVHQLLTFPGLNLICSHYTISDGYISHSTTRALLLLWVLFVSLPHYRNQHFFSISFNVKMSDSSTYRHPKSWL